MTTAAPPAHKQFKHPDDSGLLSPNVKLSPFAQRVHKILSNGIKTMPQLAAYLGIDQARLAMLYFDKTRPTQREQARLKHFIDNLRKQKAASSPKKEETTN